jgi:hypothetical protein
VIAPKLKKVHGWSAALAQGSEPTTRWDDDSGGEATDIMSCPILLD